MLPGPLTVKFKIVDSERFKDSDIVYKMLRMGGDDEATTEYTPFTRNGDVISATMNVEEGEFKMKISHTFGHGHERNICNYHAICEPPPKPKEEEKAMTPEPDEESELRQKRRDAIEAQDLELLERAVDLTESKNFGYKLGPEVREAKDLIARLKRLQKLLHEVN